MSIESAREFVNKVASDEHFRKQLNACKTGVERQKFAQAAGYDFTGEEIKAAANEIQDEDLDRVSGAACCGATCEPEIPPCPDI